MPARRAAGTPFRLSGEKVRKKRNAALAPTTAMFGTFGDVSPEPPDPGGIRGATRCIFRRQGWANYCRAAQPLLHKPVGRDASLEPEKKLAFMMCTHPRLGAECMAALPKVATERGLAEQIFLNAPNELCTAWWSGDGQVSMDNYWNEGKTLGCVTARPGMHEGALAERWVFETKATPIPKADETHQFYCTRLHAALSGRFVVIPLPRDQVATWDGKPHSSQKCYFRFWNEDGSRVWDDFGKYRDGMEFMAEHPGPAEWETPGPLLWCQVKTSDGGGFAGLRGPVSPAMMKRWNTTATEFWDAMWSWRFRRTTRVDSWDRELLALEKEAQWKIPPKTGHNFRLTGRLEPPAPPPPALGSDEYLRVCELKAAGNQSFQRGEFADAARLYEEALDLYLAGWPMQSVADSHERRSYMLFASRDGSAGEQFDDKVKLLSNLAECLLREERYTDAWTVANQTLYLDGTCVKARVRRCKADIALVTSRADDKSIHGKSSADNGPQAESDLAKLEIMKKLGVSGVPTLTALRKEASAASQLHFEQMRARMGRVELS